MKLLDYMNDYLLYAKHEQGLSERTTSGYQSWLRHYHRWMTENGYPEPSLTDYTTPTLRRYLYYLAGKNYRPRTIHGAFHPLRSMGEFLVKNGALKDNPAAAVTLPRKDAAIRLTVSDEEITKLIEACERQRSAFRVAFSRAVLSVLVYAGLRRSELCDLEVGDINTTEKSLLVKCGKGSKSRRLYLCEECVTALQEWLALRPKDSKHDYLFAYDRNRRIHHNGLHTLIEDLKATAGLRGADNVLPHSLRHACATRLLRNGANLRDIQAFLGHSSLAITSQYLHSSEEQLRSIAHLSSIRSPAPTSAKVSSRYQRQSLRD